MVYSIDLLVVDHVNDRIVGLSNPRSYSTLEGVSKTNYLLHLISTGTSSKIVYTIKFYPNGSDKSVTYHPRAILFNSKESSMYLVYSHAKRLGFYRIKFPTTF